MSLIQAHAGNGVERVPHPSETGQEGACLANESERINAAGGEFDRQFRVEIAKLIHEILRRNYVDQCAVALKEAYRRGTTIEQVVASTITQLVMKKVDDEYY